MAAEWASATSLAATACSFAASASVSIFAAAARLSSMIATTGRKRNLLRIQTRTRTLTVCRPSVHQSIRIADQASLDVRVGEQDQEGDHQTIDRHGLDHRKPDEERARNRSRRLGLARNRLHRRGDRPPFSQARSDRAEAHSQSCGENADGLDDVVHSVAPSGEASADALGRSPTAWAMKTVASTAKM